MLYTLSFYVNLILNNLFLTLKNICLYYTRTKQRLEIGLFKSHVVIQL